LECDQGEFSVSGQIVSANYRRPGFVKNFAGASEGPFFAKATKGRQRMENKRKVKRQKGKKLV